MPVDALAGRLQRLLSEGSIVSSALTRRMRGELEPLFFARALVLRKAGGGRHVVVEDRGALQSWVEATYPSGLEGIEDELRPRAEGVANFRDSKAGRPLLIRPAFIRGFGNATLMRGGGAMPLAELTRAHDLTGVLVDPANPWALDGVLALVENLELFVHVEKVVPGIDAALWTAGRLDQRVLNWIAAMPAVRVVHVGDYDPVGLDEYLRVRAAMPAGRASLFVPTDFEARLARYGKLDLLHRSAAVLERVRRDGPAEVQEVLSMMDRHGKALEQEALLIGVAGSSDSREDHAVGS